MLPKKRRVEKGIFKEVTQARSLSSLFATIKVLKTNGPAKVSFVVSKKVAKSAIERNSLRRKGYAMIKNILPKIKDNIILIFYVKKEMIALSHKTLIDQCEDSLKRVGILQN